MKEFFKSLFIRIVDMKIERYGRIVVAVLTVFLLFVSLITGEYKKRSFTQGQLNIEQQRIEGIDKQLTELYESVYSGIDSDVKLKRIAFLKSQRIEAVKAIEEINKDPSTQILIFTIIITVLSLTIVGLFSSSLGKKSWGAERYQRQAEKVDENQQIFEWILENEITDKDANLDLEKVKIWKEVFQYSNRLGNKKHDFLQLVSSLSELNRSGEDLNGMRQNELFEVFEDIRSRLRDECSRLNNQALINLAIGFLLAFMLLGVNGYLALFSYQLQYREFSVFFINFLPKLFTVISILTMFIYFIRLYKGNLNDVKYYQNEITNVEAKLGSLRLGLISSEKPLLDFLAKELISTERNTIFSKDQTTLELERLRLEHDINKDVLTKAWDLLGVTKVAASTKMAGKTIAKKTMSTKKIGQD